jgi:membrane protein
MTPSNRPYAIASFMQVMRNAFKELVKNDPLRMAGATAFFTTFALPPILIILIQTLGLVFDPKNISRQLFLKLGGIIGRESVQQIINTLIAFRRLAENWYITVGGFIFLLFIATTLFKVIKSSLNQVWKIKVVKKQGVIVSLRTRLNAVIVILVAGLLFVIGLVAEGLQAYMGRYIFELSPLAAFYFNNVINHLVSVIIVTLWFVIVFRLLPVRFLLLSCSISASWCCGGCLLTAISIQCMVLRALLYCCSYLYSTLPLYYIMVPLLPKYGVYIRKHPLNRCPMLCITN